MVGLMASGLFGDLIGDSIIVSAKPIIMYRTRVRPSVFDRMGSRYNHFFDFDHFLGRNALDESWIANKDWIKNSTKKYKIQVPLPGFSKKDIQVQLNDHTLEVRIFKNGADQEDQQIEVGKRYYHLPANLDLSAIKVRFKNGLLRVSIPYLEGLKESTKISVQ